MESCIKHVVSNKIAPPMGPYSHAVVAGNLVFISGTFGLDVATGQFVCGGTAEEFRQTLKNIDNILQEVGSSFDKLVSLKIILNNLKDLCVVNSIYKDYFLKIPFPSRTVHQGKLPMAAGVQVDAVALTGPVYLKP